MIYKKGLFGKISPKKDTFSYTIKWFFDIFAAILLAVLIYYTTSH